MRRRGQSKMHPEAKQPLLAGASSGESDVDVHDGVCEALLFAWQFILNLSRLTFCYVAALLSVLFPFKKKPVLTEKQEERLRDLWVRSQIQFDSNATEHVKALKELWTAAFPEAPWTGKKSAKWSEMGWQGLDPATDFRGGGLLALQSLLDLHRLEPRLFRKLLEKTEGERSDWEYPFAVAGVNITFTLTEMLQLRNASSPGCKEHIRGFIRLLETEEDLFSKLFCAMFALLDKEWLAMKASYMEFPAVMKVTRQRVEGALRHHPKSVRELKQLLTV